MPPKPGFWYYDSIRAFKVYLLIAVFWGGLYLSKVELPTQDDILEIYLRYRLSVLVTVAVVVLGILLVRFVIKRAAETPTYNPPPKGIYNPPPKGIVEPHPSSFRSREEFIGALRLYGRYKGYKPKWVDFRTNELWPLGQAPNTVKSADKTL